MEAGLGDGIALGIAKAGEDGLFRGQEGVGAGEEND